MARDGAEVIRRLAAKAADERTPMNERIVAALEACRRIERDKLYGIEEHEKPAHRTKRIQGPWYVKREDEKRYYFIYWRNDYASGGIPVDGVKELTVMKEAIIGACWLNENGKRRALSCCPSQPVAAWLDVAVDK